MHSNFKEMVLACAQGAIPIGQKVRTRARDAWQNVLKPVEQLFAQGHSCENILGAVYQSVTSRHRVATSTAVCWRVGFTGRIAG